MPNQNRRLWWQELLIIFVLFGLLSTQALAASFDCKKAFTKMEKAVCSNPKLSELDEQLAKAYHDALASLSPEGQKETKEYQRKWLKELSSYAEDSLYDPYEARIKQLQQILIKFPDRVFRKVYVADSETDKSCEINDRAGKWLEYPQIENPRNENEKFWNHLISQKAIDKFKRYEGCTDIVSIYTVRFSDKHLISCVGEDDVFEHGAPHPYKGCDCLNWLLETRRKLELVDVFNNNTDWCNKLAALITHKKKEQEATDTCCRYIAPGEDLTTGFINIDQIRLSDWMVLKDGLAFRFERYNQRYYVLITIDWKTLDPYLSKNGRSLIND